MKITKEHIIGVVIGLAIVVATKLCYDRLELLNAGPAKAYQHAAYPASDSGKASLDDIVFAELQISAVVIDMDRYLGWFPDEKEMLKEASVKAVGDLTAIKQHLRELTWPDELTALRDDSLVVADKLIDIYRDIESARNEDIKQSFNEFDNVRAQYCEELRKACEGANHQLPKDCNATGQEVKWIMRQQDKDVYLYAVGFIKQRQFNQAYAVLTGLRERCKGTVFESCIMVRMSDCLLMSEPSEKADTLFDYEKGIDLLSEILDAGSYSPLLFETFYKWRTQTQFYWHGMSNTSDIPNSQYNLKRLQAMQTIRHYLKEYPGDIWAVTQANLLMRLPNIGRGGVMGNDALSDWAVPALHPGQGENWFGN